MHPFTATYYKHKQIQLNKHHSDYILNKNTVLGLKKIGIFCFVWYSVYQCLSVLTHSLHPGAGFRTLIRVL